MTQFVIMAALFAGMCLGYFHPAAPTTQTAEQKKDAIKRHSAYVAAITKQAAKVLHFTLQVKNVGSQVRYPRILAQTVAKCNILAIINIMNNPISQEIARAILRGEVNYAATLENMGLVRTAEETAEDIARSRNAANNAQFVDKDF